MSHINSWKHLGKTALVQQDCQVIHGMNLLMLRPNKAVMLPRYANYYFTTNSFKEQLHRISNQSVNQSSFSVTKLRDLFIPLPPLHIQEQIADTLDKADALRRKDQELLQKYDELAQAIFYDMFGDPKDWFGKWEKVRLVDVCNKLTDGEHGTVERLDTGKLYLMARNIRDNYIDLSEVSYISEKDHYRIYKRCNPEFEDLLLVCVGATIGRVSLVPQMEEFSLARSVALIKPNRDKLDPAFLYTLFKSDYMQKQIANSGNSSAQAGLYTGKIKDLELFLPPINKQTTFGKLFKQIQNSKSKKIVTQDYSHQLFKVLKARLCS